MGLGRITDDGTATDMHEVRDAPNSLDLVARHQREALQDMRENGRSILLQHQAGECGDCLRPEGTVVEPVPPEPTPAPGALSVHLTFYVCAGAPPGQSYCGRMASGATVYEGAAACGYGMALGTQFLIRGDPTGRAYTCEDRGAGPHWWIDVFWYSYADGKPWRNQFGQDVEIVLL